MNKKQYAAHKSSTQEQPEWLQEKRKHSESSEPETLAELPKVQVYNGRLKYSVDSNILASWQNLEPEWVDKRLHIQFEDMLRGLDRPMVQEVIGCLTYYINWGIRIYLDLWHIDQMLKTAYNKLDHAASQHGQKIPLFP